MSAFDAVVLAGGRASRLGGRDKTTLVFGGESLLERAIAATAGAALTVVVGPERERGEVAGRPAEAAVRWTLEAPRFGGPAAALGAGVAVLAATDRADAPRPWVLVLAADLPYALEAARALLAGLAERDGAARARDASPAVRDGLIAVDETGRDQPLLAVYRTEALRAALAAHGDLAGLPLRAITGGLALERRPLPGPLTADVDEPADAAALGIALVDEPADEPRATPGSPAGAADRSTGGATLAR